MYNLHNSLCSAKFFVDNEYLEKYCQIIERNTRTRFIPRRTHKHHIIPRCWFKLTNQVINNDLNNLVNLPIREHVLAHYYLCLCTVDEFKFANELALVCLSNSNNIDLVEKTLLHNLPLYNNIYEDYLYKVKSNYRLYTKGEK